MLIWLKGFGFAAQFPHPWTWNNNAPSFTKEPCCVAKWQTLSPCSRDQGVASLFVIFPTHTPTTPDLLTMNSSLSLHFNTFYLEPFGLLNLAYLPGLGLCWWTLTDIPDEHYITFDSHIIYPSQWPAAGILSGVSTHSAHCHASAPLLLDKPVSQPAVPGEAAAALAGAGAHISPWLLALPPTRCPSPHCNNAPYVS